MEIGREELLGEIKKWYNGMRFVRKCEGATWDVRYDYPNKEIRDSWYSIIVGRHRGADAEDGCGV